MNCFDLVLVPTLCFTSCCCVLTAASVPVNAVIPFRLYVPLVMNPGKASLLHTAREHYHAYPWATPVRESCLIQQIYIGHLISVMHCYRHVEYVSEQKKPKAFASRS